GVSVAAPAAGRGLTVIYGNLNHAMQVTGTDNRYLQARDWTVATGREFTDSEIASGGDVCILGETVRQALFQDTDPTGETVRLRDIPCKVIGVLDKKGA